MSLGFFDSWNLGCPDGRSVAEVGEDELKLTSASFAVVAAAVAAVVGESHTREALRAASLRNDAEGWHSHLREQLKMRKTI